MSRGGLTPRAAGGGWRALLRHAIAVLTLPFTVVVVVPAWLLLFAVSLGRFGREGHGTLAASDPPKREERQLEARFGDEYRRYRRSVPRFVPRWPRRSDGSAATRTSARA